MSIITGLGIAIIFVMLLRNPIRKVPVLFYVLALAYDLLPLLGQFVDLPVFVTRYVIPFNTRCLFAFGLFIVVMYIGVLKKNSSLRHWLYPIRAEISIIATILAMGHVVRYLTIYLPRFVNAPGSMPNQMIISFGLALLITILLFVLGITSFKCIKKHMSPAVWKKIQRLAYPFFVLVYVHIILILGASAMRGGERAIISLATYGVLTVLYIILRLVRYRADRAEALKEAKTA